MKNLFLKSLTNLLKDIGIQNLKINDLNQMKNLLVKKFEKNIKAEDLVRLPDNQLRTMLKIPCPTQNMKQDEVQIFKHIRSAYNIEQPNVCSKCPNIKHCPVKNIQSNLNEKIFLQHILFFMSRLSLKKSSDYSQLRWGAAYKVCQSIRICLKDPYNIKIQSILYRSALKQQKKHIIKSPPQKGVNNDIYKDRKFYLKLRTNEMH